jgi:hypothetical protein
MVLTLLCAACGNIVAVNDRRIALRAGSPDYAGIADLPYETLPFPTDERFNIDDKSPILAFGDQGQSHVKGFELPVRSQEYQLVLQSRVFMGGFMHLAAFFPLITFLDAEKKPMQTTDWTVISAQFPDVHATYLEISRRVEPTTPFRYMVVHSNRLPTDCALNLPRQGLYGPLIERINGPLCVKESAEGSLQIQLREIPK